jgi:hypothetical protein
MFCADVHPWSPQLQPNMFPIGIPVAVDAFLSSGFRIWFLVAMVALILLISAITPAAEKDDTPVTLSGCSLLNVWRFFGRRFDFLNAGFCCTGENVFQFKLLQASPFSLDQPPIIFLLLDDLTMP